MGEQTRLILDYAPRPPVRRWRVVWRIALLVLAVALALAAWRWGGRAWRQATMLYAQRQCLNYTAPPTQVVYEENATTPSPLLSRPGYRAMPAAPSVWGKPPATPPAVAVFTPACLRAYAPSARLNVYGATVFLHERRTPSGLRRLVVVQRAPAREVPFIRAFALDPEAVAPASATGSPIVKYRMGPLINWISSQNDEPPTAGLRFYAGQPDPNDPARFTIEYDLQGGHGIVDGRLSDDGNDVLLHVRTGPAAGDSNWSKQVVQPDPAQFPRPAGAP